jgi:hypothetical protein
MRTGWTWLRYCLCWNEGLINTSLFHAKTRQEKNTRKDTQRNYPRLLCDLCVNETYIFIFTLRSLCVKPFKVFYVNEPLIPRKAPRRELCVEAVSGHLIIFQYCLLDYLPVIEGQFRQLHHIIPSCFRRVISRFQL